MSRNLAPKYLDVKILVMKKHDIVQHDMKWLDVDVHEIDTRSMATPPDDPDELDHLDASLVIWARRSPISTR